MTDSPEQQVIIVRGATSGAIESKLNELAAEGWRLQDVTQRFVLKSTSIYGMDRAYCLMPELLTVARSRSQVTYRCRTLEACRSEQADADRINEEIGRQRADRFRLVRTLPRQAIGVDAENLHRGPLGYLLLFEADGNRGDQQAE
jgi:hypothetical protein